MEQQNQALRYFSDHALDWQQKSTQSNFSAIHNRHLAVLAALKAQNNPKRFLDVGCGTGQLAIAISKMGLRSLGIDFSPSMIDLCKKNNEEAQGTAQFMLDSIFNVTLEKSDFDLISAQGFIEYISDDQLNAFFQNTSKWLRKSGALVIGSRNRLFNLHSLNEYTSMELKLKNVEMLLQEAILIQNAQDQDSLMHGLQELKPNYTHPASHPETGILVDTRYQFTPAELMNKLKNHGFRSVRIYPVHFHGFPLSTQSLIKNFHHDMANLICERFIEHHEFIPYSSSFVLEAIKE